MLPKWYKLQILPIMAGNTTPMMTYSYIARKMALTPRDPQ